jgi:soluble lytic murein transglycosylase-like protein
VLSESRVRLLFAVLIASSGFTSTAYAGCFEEAATYQHVNPLILQAIAWQESHYHADAMHLNENGSIDYGLMQINTIHLRNLSRYGIGKEALMSPCKSVFVAAWHLRMQMNKYGNTWAAVGAYHSATPALRDDYALRIASIVNCFTQGAPGDSMPGVTQVSAQAGGEVTRRRGRARSVCPMLR